MTSRSLDLFPKKSLFEDDPFFQDSIERFNKFESEFDSFFSRPRRHQTDFGLKPLHDHHDIFGSIKPTTTRQAETMYPSQAIHVTEKDGLYQAVLDVKDFNPRELQVRAVDNRVIVEGSYEKYSQDGSNASSKAFYKELVMPATADIDKVTTALSKDGLLTVKAPKKDIAQITSSGMPSYSTSDAMNHHGLGKKSVQNSSSFESVDSGMESLPRDIRERLFLSDAGSVSGRSSSCTSPSPSETYSDAPSESSRVSTTMEFDIGNKGNMQKSEVTFNVGAAAAGQNAQNQQQSTGSHYNPAAPPGTMTVNSGQKHPQGIVQSNPTLGSGATTSINVSEENGKRILTKESSNVIQEKDGFMETKETAAEISDKDSQAARREASTRTMRSQEDPEGRFKRSEAADASDVSESCVQRLPDGSLMKVNKSSTSSSSFKQSFSSNLSNDPMSLIDSGFPSDFGDLKSLMGRGHDLMSQMNSEPMGSSLSARSFFSDMPGFGDMSGFSNFPSMSNAMSNMSSFSTRSQDMQSSNLGSTNSKMSKSSVSSSSSSFSSSSFNSAFDNMKF